MSHPIHNHNDEADRESTTEVLSLSNGHFAGGHSRSGEVLVSDPSQSSLGQDKASEAQSEQQTGGLRRPGRLDTSTRTASWQPRTRQSPRSEPESPTIATSPSQRSLVDFAEPVTQPTPLTSSAPPAYSPPEPGSPYHPQHIRNTSTAGIYETMGGRQEQFFPNRQENLGGESQPLLGGNNNDKNWRKRLGGWWAVNSNKVFKYIVLCLAIFLALGFILSAVVQMKTSSDKDNKMAPPNKHDIPSYCQITGSGKLDFEWENAKDFSLVHLPKPVKSNKDWIHVQNLGKIHIKSSTNDATEDMRVNVEYYYSNDQVLSGFEFFRDDNLLRIHSAGSVQNYNEPRGYVPCFYMDITIWVKPNLQQESFSIATTTLNVIIEQNHTAKANQFVIETQTGSIKSFANAQGEAHWGGRDISIVTGTSSIQGAYPLYDSLSLESQTGSISVDLTLESGVDGKETEARLAAKSGTGTVTIKTPIVADLLKGMDGNRVDDVPKRDYRTDVVVGTGSVHLQAVHGSYTHVTSRTGTIHASLVPWLSPNRDSEIFVHSNTGSIALTVEDSLAYPKEPLRNLYSKYEFSTGNLELRYPAEWEGHVYGQLVTGSTNIDWPGLQVINSGRNGLYRSVEAVKGKGAATLKFTGGSGSVNLMGRGGGNYPNATSDHRKVVPGSGELPDWPIILPPMLQKGS